MEGFVMKRTTIEYYKMAVKRAENAMEVIKKANTAYENECILAKDALHDGILGENGYKEQLEKLTSERDAKIEGALGQIDEVAAEYSAEMEDLCRLDGRMIDDGTMKLLDSGLALSSADWQELANKHKDNYVMSRILKARYDANRPKEDELVIVRFGQSPQDRQEVFGNFTRLICNACTSKYMPGNGTADFASRKDWWNYLAKASLKKMEPFGDESFDTVEQDFPVEHIQAGPMVF